MDDDAIERVPPAERATGTTLTDFRSPEAVQMRQMRQRLIPKGAQNVAGAETLINWLSRPRQQAAASSSLSFFPSHPAR